MKVLLRKDVSGLGKKGDVKEVSEGYARNALLPNGSVVVASDGAVRQETEKRKGAENRKRRAARDAGRTARSIDGAVLEFVEPTAETGRLYAALGEDRIADRVEKEFGVRPDVVAVRAPIKEPGAHVVDLTFGGARARITCTVAPKGS